MTKKGKGYLAAEQDPIKYHSVNPGFYQPVPEGQTNKATMTQSSKLTYSQVFGEWLCDMAAKDPRLVALTPAMEEGSGLKDFAKQYPNRYFDVGISEQHCVTLAAGLASEGFKPVVAIYSTFLQRAYDQLIHDVALQNLPVLFAIDRAGVVGFDGPTHGGFFDLSYLRCIPNMLIMAPADKKECRQMFTLGFLQSQPSAIRYPRGAGPENLIENTLEKIQIGKAHVLRKGKTIALLAFGSMVATALKVGEILQATVVNMRFVKPLDIDLIQWVINDHNLLVTLEENVIKGGAGSAINDYLMEINVFKQVLNLGLPDLFIEHGPPEILLSHYGLDVQGILLAIEQRLRISKK
jgi:1-deoxy-D-xylulose-5-phosphate synthase